MVVPEGADGVLIVNLVVNLIDPVAAILRPLLAVLDSPGLIVLQILSPAAIRTCTRTIGDWTIGARANSTRTTCAWQTGAGSGCRSGAESATRAGCRAEARQRCSARTGRRLSGTIPLLQKISGSAAGTRPAGPYGPG